MADYKEKAGMIAAESARTRLLKELALHGLDESAVATTIREAIYAKRQVEVLTPKGWDVSPGVPDHKTRLKAVDMVLDIIDAKAPQRIDLTGGGLIQSAARTLVEEILTEQGIIIDITPPKGLPDPVKVTVPLRPSTFLAEDGLPACLFLKK